MTYQQAKGSVKSYLEGNALLHLLMKISPILIFLRPVANLLIRMMEDSYSALSFVDFLINMEALFVILFVVGWIMCFIDEKGLPLVGALVLHLIDLCISLFGAGRYGYVLIPLVYTLFYLAILAAAVIMTARTGAFQRVNASVKQLMAPRPQAAQMVPCPVCHQLNAVGVNFCTNCGSEMPPPPVVQPVAPVAPPAVAPPAVAPEQVISQPTPPPVVVEQAPVPSTPEAPVVEAVVETVADITATDESTDQK